MITLLSRLLIRPDGRDAAGLRKAYGMLCGAVGILLNVLLFSGKLLAGSLAGSVAITADAFNNLSDAGSSAITLLGFHLAGQKADAHHPFGHGRIEYLSGLGVAVLILLMGWELLQSSLSKILHPAPVAASPLVIAILCVSVGVKLYMAFYNWRLGRRLDSSAMRATATDSLCDSAATAAVLAATLAGHFTGKMVDGWAGLLVAAFILWSGVKAAKETIDPLLGTPPTREFVSRIRELVMAHSEIIGIHDLIVHDYGPGRVMISLHAEVPASQDVLALHDEIDNVERELREQLGCEAVIHMDPVVTDDGVTEETRRRVADLVRCIDDDITIHDFRMVSGPTHTNVIFDAVVPYDFRLMGIALLRRGPRGAVVYMNAKTRAAEPPVSVFVRRIFHDAGDAPARQPAGAVHGFQRNAAVPRRASFRSPRRMTSFPRFGHPMENPSKRGGFP